MWWWFWRQFFFFKQTANGGKKVIYLQNTWPCPYKQWFYLDCCMSVSKPFDLLSGDVHAAKQAYVSNILCSFQNGIRFTKQVSTLQIKQENCSLTRAIWLKAFILRWCSIETLKRNACFCCCDHSDQPTQQTVSRAAAGSLFRAFCWPHVKIQLSFRYTPVTTKSASIKEIIWHCIETIYLKSELCC